ncbi:restriction endonuclease [Candidatus Pacearchaeota archaeon CG_4_10_14_0_2_um_filter_05_32_18]|nr:MAG: restriction endonuclease [Candidatus Pacearchaeota archaeon CG1_02_32_21]PIZ83526.1 MAG: restriction endonuclease [Candidatus Pacearchaeota archaeon CG_4_10_14_0_2_um_filter_05_32_18]
MEKNNHLNTILEKSKKHLILEFGEAEAQEFIKEVKLKINSKETKEIIQQFNEIYVKKIKQKYQKETSPEYDKKLFSFIKKDNKKIKIVWGDCYENLKKLPSESVHLMVTSPPYYNAREYSQYGDLNKYLDDMKKIISECYRVLDNHHVFVFNVGDIFDNDNITTKSVWGDRRLPLGAYFIKIFEEVGFTFVDDFIWDKGEVQSERHKNGNNPYPFYQYPMNCYEHILIFHKHRLDNTHFPCPVCGTLQVNSNTQSEIGLMSWECKNLECFERSASDRGKRFSLKTNMTQSPLIREGNEVPHDLIKKWRRDIIKFSPVIKINSKGENKLGHTAPFPEDIPEIAVWFYSYKGDIVLDPFAGSFTTAIVSNKLGRIGVGMELRKDLFENAIKDNLNKKEQDFEEFN